LFKASWAALSSDEGQSWSAPARVPSIVTDGAKTWGQRTDDGRYAIVYNPVTFGSHRWPLAVATGDDGIVFENMLLINGDVPPRRYFGRAKDFGLQYVRGISEGNGDPPGSDLWLTYSSNKEDIWVSRVPVPIRSKIEGPVEDSFDELDVGGIVPDWNLQQPRWARTAVVAFPSAKDKSLQLEDRDPYDYAKAVRVFSEAAAVSVACRVFPKQSDTGRLEIEVLDHAGHRPVRIVFGSDGRVQVADGNSRVYAGPYEAGSWYRVEIVVNAAEREYDVSLNEKLVVHQAAFAEPASSVERLSLRTGEYRTQPTRQTDRYAGADLSGPDDAVTPATYYVDDVVIR
jgi:hypothetical protein